MPRKNLTDVAIRRLPKPTKPVDYSDGLSIGLILRMTPAGNKSWRLRYQLAGKTSIETLGQYPAMSLASARKAAKKLRQGISEGHTPADMPSVNEFADTYIDKYSKIHNKNWKENRRNLEKDILPIIGSMKLDRVRRRDLVRVLDGVNERGAKTQVKAVYSTTRKMFNYAVERGVLEVSPATQIKIAKSDSRDVILDDEAIKLLWESTQPFEQSTVSLPVHHHMRNILRLLLVTGARSQEVSGIRLSELDLDKRMWTLPYWRSKNGLTHTTPLSCLAMEIIDSALETSENGFLFPANNKQGHVDVYQPSKAMRKIFGGAYTPHDLRRTCATRISGLGFNRLIVDKLLNHKDNSIGGVYDRHSYDDEKREALTRWNDAIRDIL